MSSNNAELFRFFYTAQTTLDDDFCYAVDSEWFNIFFNYFKMFFKVENLAIPYKFKNGEP